jgi:hypothetical protein
MADTFDQIVGEVGDALSGVIDAFTTEAGFVEVATALGWDLEHPPGPLAAIAAPANALAAAVEALADPPTPSQLAAVQAAVPPLVTALQSLNPAAFPAELAELAETFAIEALAQSILDYLFREHRLVLHALRVLAIVRFDYVPATPTRAGRIRRRVLWDNIGRLLDHPADAYREAYGWGTPAFDSVGFLGAVQDLLCSLRWPAGLAALPPALADALAASTQGPPNIAITLRLLESDVGTAGLRLVALPGTATALPALSLLPFMSSGLAAKIPVDDHLDLEIGGTLDLQGGVGVKLTPEAGVTLVLGLADPSSASVGAGTVDVAIDIHDPDRQPMDLLAVGSMVMRATTAIGRAGAKVDTLGGHDLFIELELKDATFAFDSGGDGLLASQVPANAKSGFSIAVGFSLARGLYLRGGNGLAARIPVGARLGPLSLDALDVAIGSRTGGGVGISITTELGFTVGPVDLHASGLGLDAAVTSGSGGRFGLGDVTLSPTTPTKIAVGLTGPLISGGGEIVRDPVKHRYGGALAVRIGPVGATAATIIETDLPPPATYSFAAAIAATFPAIELGAGFTLDGLGGMLMLHRAPDVDAIRAALRTGGAQALLFPAANQLDKATSALETWFHPAPGRHLIGPAGRFGWAGLARAELAVLVEIPSPITITVIGGIEVGLPTLDQRIVDLRLDLLGVWDIDRDTLSLDASLHDSKIAGYPVAGDMALRAGWGSDRFLLLAIGGFHPQFTPPPGFPTLRRLSLTAGDNPRLQLDAYLALTSNTAQVGAHAQLAYHGGGFEIAAALGFDALFEFVPFHFEIELSASASVSWKGQHLLGLSLDATLSGPHPWHAKGDASFSVLWWDVSVGFDETWGDGTPAQLPPAPDVAKRLHDALAAPEAWSFELQPDERPWVTTSSTDRGHPHAALVIRQRAVPLDYDVDLLDTVPLGHVERYAIASATVPGQTLTPPPVSDAFAPGQFTQMSAADRLVAPSFESLHAGVSIGADAVARGATVTSAMDIETVVVDPLAPPAPPVRGVLDGVLAAGLASLRAQPPAPGAGPTLAPLAYALATVDGLRATPETLALAGNATTYNALASAARRASVPLQVVTAPELG